jgi:hypothetical protein
MIHSTMRFHPNVLKLGTHILYSKDYNPSNFGSRINFGSEVIGIFVSPVRVLTLTGFTFQNRLNGFQHSQIP